MINCLSNGNYHHENQIIAKVDIIIMLRKDVVATVCVNRLYFGHRNVPLVPSNSRQFIQIKI